MALDLALGSLDDVKLKLDAPAVTTISVNFSTEGAAITGIMMDLVKQCPKIEALVICAGAAALDVDLLWASSATLRSVDLNGTSFYRS